jgi:hypothetical protein
MKDYKYRSGLEERIAKDLHDQGIAFDYEERRVKYLLSEHRSYKPDFELPNGIIIEAKGRFKPEDRKKHLLIKEQHPDLDIRFVFSNPNAKLGKGAKSTCADWCDKYGFKYSKEKIPLEWLNE